MKRRNLLKSTLFGGMAVAAQPVKASAVSRGSERQTEFAKALLAQPWLVGYAHSERERYQADAKVNGVWPERLQGTLYRNGPAAHELGNYRYSHWFDGDGLMHAYRIRNNQVSHQAAYVNTKKRQAEKKARRPLYSGFDSVVADPGPVTGPNSSNVANISVLHHHGKLMALWEAGAPWQIDESDLSTHGMYAFSEETRGVPFSAHPRVEPDGTLWNVGYASSANLLVLWHIGSDGKIKKMGKVAASPITMVHDFVVTERHIVVLFAPFHYEHRDAASFLQAHQWHPADPTRVLVVDKNDFSTYRWLELPAQWVFHFGNAWEDKDGVIRFDAASYEDPSVMTLNFREIMRGNLMPVGRQRHYGYRIDTRTGECSQQPLFGSDLLSEFPSIDPRVSCRRYNKLYMLTQSKNQPRRHNALLSAVSGFDFATGKMDTYHYPEHQIPEEHLYVPDREAGAEQGGWVIGTALDWREQRMILNASDARSLNDGPVASATLPYAMPLGLHGKFVHA